MENQLQLQIITTESDLSQRTIESNIKDLIPAVEASCDTYLSTQYTVDQEKTCKEHRARINKFLTALNGEIKRVGELNNIPFVKFRGEISPMINKLEDTLDHLDGQLDEMENRWRTINLENAKRLYDDIIGTAGYAEWIPWEKVLITKKTARVTYEADFGNKGSWSYTDGVDTNDIDALRDAGRKVCETLNQFLAMVTRKIDTLNNYLDYPDDIKSKGLEYLKNSYDPLKKGLDFDGAVALMTDLKRREQEKIAAVREAEEKAKRAAYEASVKAEAEKQKAIEETKRKLEEQMREMEAKKKAEEEAKKQKPSMPDEPRQWVNFSAHLTTSDAFALRDFFLDRGIEFKQI